MLNYKNTLAVLSAISVVVLLSSCAPSKPICPKPDHDFLNNPSANGVAYFVDKKGKHCILPRNVQLDPDITFVRYHQVGTIKVYNHNASGIKRQQATIDDLLREQAAAKGGNAVIKIKQHNHYTLGTAILIMKNK